MTADDDVLVASIDELLQNCRSALIALLPAAEQAMLTWTDDNQHRDWERLVECVFDVFVRGPILADHNRTEGEFTLARYDLDRGDYASASWISCSMQIEADLAFVRFVTENEPFDTVEAVEVDTSTYETGDIVRIPWRGQGFVYVRRAPNRHESRVTHIEAND